MKVLVTGGAGYIGSVCVEELCNLGHEVVVFDNLTEGHRSAVDSKATFVQGCLTNPTAIKEAVRKAEPEAVIHYAAFALVGESMTNPRKYFSNNVGGGMNLLDACMETGVKKVVFSSTCATYGIPEQVPITEETPQNPINPYGDTKLIFEKMLRWYGEIHGLEYVAFRYFNASGASARLGEHHRIETHLIPNVLKVALRQKTHCEIFGTDYPTPDGTCVRDYIHISDLAESHIRALQPGFTGFYNLGTGKGYSVREVIETCEEVTGQSITVVERPRRAGDPPKLVAAADRVRKELRWAPKYTGLTDIVKTAWAWHREHPDGYPD